MKPTIGFLLAITFLASCSKSALQPDQPKRLYQQFIADVGEDDTTQVAATFCYAKDYLHKQVIVTYVNNIGIDSAHAFFHAHQVVFYKGDYTKPIYLVDHNVMTLLHDSIYHRTMTYNYEEVARWWGN